MSGDTTVEACATDIFLAKDVRSADSDVGHLSASSRIFIFEYILVKGDMSG